MRFQVNSSEKKTYKNALTVRTEFASQSVGKSKRRDGFGRLILETGCARAPRSTERRISFVCSRHKKHENKTRSVNVSRSAARDETRVEAKLL